MPSQYTIYLYDQVGPREYGLVDDTRIVEELELAKNAPVRLRINSPGGDVFTALSIFNALRRHKPGVDVSIDALAASAASVIAMAGRTIEVAQNALVMIHRAWTIVAGNAETLTKTVEILNKTDVSIRDTYAARSGKSPQQIDKWLDAETWFTAQEAVDAGLADSIGEKLNVAVRASGRDFKNPPASLWSRSDWKYADGFRQAGTLSALKFTKTEPGLMTVAASAGEQYTPEKVAAMIAERTHRTISVEQARAELARRR